MSKIYINTETYYNLNNNAFVSFSSTFNQKKFQLGSSPLDIASYIN